MLTSYPGVVISCLMKYKSWISTRGLLKEHTDCLLLRTLSCCTYTVTTKVHTGKHVTHLLFASK